MRQDVSQAVVIAARIRAGEYAELYPGEQPSSEWVTEIYARDADATQWPGEARSLYQTTFVFAVGEASES